MRQRSGLRAGWLTVFSILLMSAIALPAFADGRSFPTSLHEEAWKLLTAEIARDRELTSHGINRARLSQVQETLAPDLERKREMIDFLSIETTPPLASIREVLETTLADEKRIVEGGSTQRFQRSAERTLKGNLTKKEAALAALESATR